MHDWVAYVPWDSEKRSPLPRAQWNSPETFQLSGHIVIISAYHRTFESRVWKKKLNKFYFLYHFSVRFDLVKASLIFLQAILYVEKIYGLLYYWVSQFATICANPKTLCSFDIGDHTGHILLTGRQKDGFRLVTHTGSSGNYGSLRKYTVYSALIMMVQKGNYELLISY